MFHFPNGRQQWRPFFYCARSHVFKFFRYLRFDEYQCGWAAVVRSFSSGQNCQL